MPWAGWAWSPSTRPAPPARSGFTSWSRRPAGRACRPPSATQAALAAADALLQAWPPQAVPAASGQALRDCTARLHQIAGVLLWNPECHPVLVRAYQCLDSAGLVGPAIAYWQSMIDIGLADAGCHRTRTRSSPP